MKSNELISIQYVFLFIFLKLKFYTCTYESLGCTFEISDLNIKLTNQLETYEHLYPSDTK